MLLSLAAALTLAQRCAPDVAPETLLSVAHAESGFDSPPLWCLWPWASGLSLSARERLEPGDKPSSALGALQEPAPAWRKTVSGDRAQLGSAFPLPA